MVSSFDSSFEELGIPQLFEEFSESVTLSPANGDAPRTVSAILNRRQSVRQSDTTHDNVEEWEVEITTDPDNADFGGSPVLRVNDAIVRGVEADPDQRPLLFSGEYKDQSSFSNVAIFRRARRINQGKGQ